MYDVKRDREVNLAKYNMLVVVKKILFGYNFFLWTTGCIAACIGIWFRIDRDLTTLIQRIEDSDLSLTAAKIYLGSNVLISVGSLILFIGLIGVYGSVKENEYVLSLYAFLLVGTFGLYMTVAGWGFYSLDYLKGIVSDAMRELFAKALIDFDQRAKYAVNEIQKQLQCCGNVGPGEYANDIPPSCSAYVIGCNTAFYDFYRRYILILTLIGFFFGLFQIFGIFLSIYFAKEVRTAKIIVSKRDIGPYRKM